MPKTRESNPPGGTGTTGSSTPPTTGTASTVTPANGGKADGTPKKEDWGSHIRTAIAIIIGVAALVWYWTATSSLWDNVKAEQKDWDRFLMLYDGIRSIALASVGFFFGAKVTLDRAEKAEKKADEAAAKKDESLKDKTNAVAAEAAATTKLESLLTTVEGFTMAKAGPVRSQGTRRTFGGPQASVGEDIAEHAEMLDVAEGAGSQPVDPDWAKLSIIARGFRASGGPQAVRV